MKAKVKIDLTSIKSWMLSHGEKVAFAIVGLVFLLFVYSALQRESLDDQYEPEKMKTLAENVEQHLTASKWDAGREQLKIVNYADRAVAKPVKLGDFPLPPLDAPESDPKARRGVPSVLPPEELRVAAGMDVFKLKGDGDGEGGGSTKLQAQPWAVVTGLVPYQRQRGEYAKAFENAINYSSDRDVPRYGIPQLERTVVDPANPDKVDWQRVTFPKQFEDKWTAAAPEIIADDYRNTELTAPLGDLVVGKWGESVSHPKVPLKGEDLKEPEAPAADEAPKEEPAADAPAQDVFRRPGATCKMTAADEAGRRRIVRNKKRTSSSIACCEPSTTRSNRARSTAIASCCGSRIPTRDFLSSISKTPHRVVRGP